MIKPKSILKNFIIYSFILIFSVSGFFYAPITSAEDISIDDIESIIRNTVFYEEEEEEDVCVDPLSTSPVSGASILTFPTDAEDSAMEESIANFIQNRNSNSTLLGHEHAIVAGSRNSDINPFLITAIAAKESAMADPGDFNIRNANNAFGRTAITSQPNFYSASVDRYWYKWDSVRASVDHTAEEHARYGQLENGGDIASYIRVKFGEAIDRGDLAQTLSDYAPPHENNTEEYISSVDSWMDEMHSAAQSAGNSTGAQARTGPQNEPVGGGSNTYILGDSIAVGLESAGIADRLSSAVGGQVTINADGNRGISAPLGVETDTNALQAADQDADVIASAGIVIIVLGTNVEGSGDPGGYTPRQTELMEKLKDINNTANYFWVDVGAVGEEGANTSRSSWSNINKDIYDNAQEFGYQVISRYKAILGEGADPLNIEFSTDFGGDGIHGNNEQLVNAIIEAVGSGPSLTKTDDCICKAGDGSTLSSGDDVPDIIWNYLVGDMSFTDTQAAGMMGNIQQESTFNPAATNGPTIGIIQWLGGRRTNLQNFATERGTSEIDLTTQLDFMKHELEGDYLESTLEPLRESNNIVEATRIILENYEVPCIEPGAAECFEDELNKRLPFAEEWMNGIGGSSLPPGSSGCPGGSSTGNWIWPAEGIVYSCYGYARGRLHSGIDISPPSGTPVHAADGGNVIYAEHNGRPGEGFGETIIIDHLNGFFTLYAHMLSGSYTVGVGDSVAQGQKIGEVGNTGSSTGPHLHFNIQKTGSTQPLTDDNTVDPLSVLPQDPGRPVNASGGDCPESL